MATEEAAAEGRVNGNGKKYSRYDPAVIERVFDLHDRGASWKELAEQLEIPLPTLHFWAQVRKKQQVLTAPRAAPAAPEPGHEEELFCDAVLDELALRLGRLTIENIRLKMQLARR